MSLLAKSSSVTLDDATTCAGFIMTFPDFSYLMCLLNTTELVADAWMEGEECPTITLDGNSQLMVVDMSYSCTDGYEYVQEADGQGHTCFLKPGNMKRFQIINN